MARGRREQNRKDQNNTDTDKTVPKYDVVSIVPGVGILRVATNMPTPREGPDVYSTIGLWQVCVNFVATSNSAAEPWNA